MYERTQNQNTKKTYKKTIFIESDAPFVLLAFHHYGIAISGFANAVVWSRSESFEPWHVSLIEMLEEKESQNMEMLDIKL